MFYNLRRYIFLYYFITVIIFGGGFSYVKDTAKPVDAYIIITVFLILVVISGIIISKLAIEPLEEYVTNLEELSRDTLHELNLPIATIKTNVDMIEKKLSDEKSLKRLSRIKTACNMLTQRYNELDYMIKRQTKREIIERFDLKELIDERVEFLRNIYVEVEFTKDLENFIINMDKIGLSKVIDNIIDNGVKYSQNANKIDITLKNKVLRIKDYGIGIDEVVLLRIFDRYYQNDDSMPGFGIGLSMVKRFCDTHRIKLNIESKKGSGTTIFLDFKGS
ncbi:HAMP domain-containing sensor histidine kinase [Sulfurimonas sp. HSL-1716]|uniref:sensor histidine kinase n=1 Tax=Hydrocurvibacter sulfurireducens TaxID=3131937 RepID=UPI0031F77187